jgi:hypothetical protein
VVIPSHGVKPLRGYGGSARHPVSPYFTPISRLFHQLFHDSFTPVSPCFCNIITFLVFPALAGGLLGCGGSGLVRDSGWVLQQSVAEHRQIYQELVVLRADTRLEYPFYPNSPYVSVQSHRFVKLHGTIKSITAELSEAIEVLEKTRDA